MILGEDATAWAISVAWQHDPRSSGVRLLRADDVPLDMIAALGKQVIETVGEKRSTWRRWTLMAEAARQSMWLRFASSEDREVIVGMIADAAEQASLRLTPPELAVTPAEFRRADGSTRFRPKHSTLFSSTALLAAEDRLIARARGMAAEQQTSNAATTRNEGRRCPDNATSPDRGLRLTVMFSWACRMGRLRRCLLMWE